MAAEGALNLALRLGIPTKTVLHHLMQSTSFYESYRSVAQCMAVAELFTADNASV